jgi:hypothetical protein
MFGYRVITRLGLALALAAPLALSVGCGGSGKGAKSQEQLKPREMPADGEWTGVYYSQLFGHLHLIKDGDSMHGRWRTAAGDKWGEMHGKVDGDLFRYEWTEHKIGLVGPNASTSGKGFFRYVVPAGENVDHTIQGQWGLGSEEVGNPWEAIKQRNQMPDFNSVMPDETQKATGGGWDERKRPPGGSSSGGGGEESWD